MRSRPVELHRRRDAGGLVLPSARGGRTDTGALGCADSDSNADTYGYAVTKPDCATYAYPDSAANPPPNSNTDR